MAQREKQWYENALLLGVAGSMIAVVGQLAGTIIPIMYGPQSIEDFNIDLDTHSIIINSQNPAPFQTAIVNITISDLHRMLRPYRFKMHFHALGSINDARVIFDPPEIQLPGLLEMRKQIKSNWMHRKDPYSESRYTYNPPDVTTAYIDVNTSSTPMGDYTIVIEAIGSNGKTHNSTVTLRLVNRHDFDLFRKGSIDIKGEKIHN